MWYSSNNKQWPYILYIYAFYLLVDRYFLIMVLTITNTWRRFAIPLLLFIGAKMNAIFFYHYMEFTSATPPENLVAYFTVEGPYILSMILVVLKVNISMKMQDEELLVLEEELSEEKMKKKNDWVLFICIYICLYYATMTSPVYFLFCCCRIVLDACF